MQTSGSPFRRDALAEPRFISGSTGRVLGTLSQRKEQASMARLIGTGKDPRYGKGEVFDVPKFAPAGVRGTADHGEGERVINPTYQELIDRGLAKEQKPEDDPGRSTTQIADAVVAGRTTIADPVDVALADSIDINDAYAKVHTGDAKATAGSGDLKPQAVKDAQREDSLQRAASPAFLGQQEKPEAAREAEARSDTTDGGGSKSS